MCLTEPQSGSDRLLRSKAVAREDGTYHYSCDFLLAHLFDF